MSASGRTGSDNFVTSMRRTLALKYGDNPVGMGGVFQILSGKAKVHVMVSHSLCSRFDSGVHV